MVPFWVVLFRWIHLSTACIAVGGVFFMRIVLPISLRALDADNATLMFLRTRRVFKRVIHTCILLFLISGIYNSYSNWQAYNAGPPLGHALYGIHVLLALIFFTIALWLLAGAEPPVNYRKWLALNLALLLLAIAAASTLKYVREHSSPARPPVKST